MSPLKAGTRPAFFDANESRGLKAVEYVYCACAVTSPRQVRGHVIPLLYYYYYALALGAFWNSAIHPPVCPMAQLSRL